MVSIGLILSIAGLAVTGFTVYAVGSELFDSRPKIFMKSTRAMFGVAFMAGQFAQIVNTLRQQFTDLSLLQLAAAASITPPIANTALFGFATIHYAAQFIYLLKESRNTTQEIRQLEEELKGKEAKLNGGAPTPEINDLKSKIEALQKFNKQTNARLFDTFVSFSASVLFLVSSLVPIPGLTNMIGVSLAVGVAAVTAGAKMYEWYVNPSKTKEKQESTFNVQNSDSFSNAFHVQNLKKQEPNIQLQETDRNSNTERLSNSSQERESLSRWSFSSNPGKTTNHHTLD